MGKNVSWDTYNKKGRSNETESKKSRAENLAMSDMEQVFFWEHPEAREKLLALQSSIPVEEVSDSESVSGEVTVKRLDQTGLSTSKSVWATEELYSRRLRARDWRTKYDRMDGTGAGDHRC